MVARKSLKGDYCPSARSLDVIGDWWSLLIVRDAFDGLTRFGEFQKSLGIAKNILTERLRTLVASGILELVPTSEGGARMEYRLTAMGKDLFPVMVALRQFGERHLFAPAEEHSLLVDRATGQPVQLDIRAQDGRAIGPDETVIVKVPEGE
ncbi:MULTISPECIES: winged helix-turn-helix transcriptional regulator [Rhizobium]|uniref:DNA-binding HxlR family transcriptional regulator n=1 Tax=Rhizobium tropici TaxID=398 RepID=A0A6P1CCG6_RHITR|nr:MULTISPECIES: helix-turn-helix domain-containing protein [Rhizobium]AGB69659.1 transcriptional regulator, HxlR family [Rhizobium tropici CIAT 899]MBB4244041.1 DNA-binding HxlR family transcriptional regulator [Rhizobium tropici]MBB5595122.1 DNA-binding HxlR family transcriptional regulator [Rhizobium tropici]MBB6494380.1 DNA-binding HxlR family transcriptional regulator [Rhizobium tropici]NEV12524.1 helix-turn-helix transcriptional regulator [Rhizobium tropici]